MGRQWVGGRGPRIQPGAPWSIPPTRLTGPSPLQGESRVDPEGGQGG